MPSPFHHRHPADFLRRHFIPAGFLAAGAAAAILAGLCAAADVGAVVRATAVALLVCAFTLAGAAIRVRDHRLLARAADIATRLTPGERDNVPLTAPNAVVDAVRALKGATRSIEAREARFATLARATGDAVWEWDLDTDLVACSHGGSAVLGSRSDAFVEPFAWWQDRVHPEDRHIVEDSVAVIRRDGGALWSEEYRFLHADGDYRWVWDRGVVMTNSAGRARRIVGCMSNISARRQAEEMLQRVEMRQRSLITALSSIVWREDLQSDTQPRNLQWEEFTGQTQEEEFGEGWLSAVHPDDRDQMLSAWSNAVRNEAMYQSDIRLRGRDGRYRWMSARGAPVRDRAGKVVEMVGLYQDVDDYYKARENLSRTSEALGERVKELRCLHAVAVECNADDKAIPEILAAIALVLPAALLKPELGVCSIAWEGEDIRSPDAVAPVATLEAPIIADGALLGRIELGISARSGDVDFLPEEKRMLETAAKLVGQMLARRGDRDRLEHQSQELWRRQAMFEQTERLARIGGWEYDVARQTITWSDEVRRIADLEGEISARAGDRPALAFLENAIQDALRTHKPFEMELPWVFPNGKRTWLHMIGQVQHIDGQAVRIFGMLKDITQEKEARNHIWQLAHHDPLTNLPNRRYFHEKLEAAVTQGGSGSALLLVDLDHFKEVNDTLGHDVGDALLRAVSDRLREAAGDQALVARLGGDEFAVLAPAANRAAAIEYSESLLGRMRQPISFSGETSSVRFSAGLAVAPLDGASATEILKSADIALYFGKVRGRGAFVPYAPRMRESMELRLSVCSEVREALDRNQIEPFYQPKVSLRTGALEGFEALLRWRHPSGLRTPAALMTAFEDHDIATGLFKRMLDRIIADMSRWRGIDLPFGHVALNTSAADFTGVNLADRVLAALQEAGLPPSCLGIEVTETVLLGRDAEAAGPALRRLSEAGISIALDDFGTGYASLTHLQQYPVDIIKIDQSFIRCIETDAGCQAITSAVLGLGRSLGMTVVAEGVETPDQAKLLRSVGCDQAQGYLYAKPLPATDVADFIRNWSERQSPAQTALHAA